MASTATIISAINSKVGSNYTIYQIGITDNPSKRKEEWSAKGENTKYWAQWQAELFGRCKSNRGLFPQRKKDERRNWRNDYGGHQMGVCILSGLGRDFFGGPQFR